MTYLLAEYTVWFFAYAFVGWCWEVGLRLVQHHVFVNRGFVTGPVLPIYGVGALISVVLLHGIPGVTWQFLAACAAAAVLEYSTSWAMEKLFHARWWDYSNKPFNLHGRIYLLGIVTFGVMMVLVDRVFQPLLQDLTSLVPHLALEVVAACMACVFAADLVHSVVRMKSFNRKLEEFQDKLGELTEDARERAFVWVEDARERVEEAREAVAEKLDEGRERAAATRRAAAEKLAGRMPSLGAFERRTLRDPHFMPTRNQDAYRWLREHGRPGK